MISYLPQTRKGSEGNLPFTDFFIILGNKPYIRIFLGKICKILLHIGYIARLFSN